MTDKESVTNGIRLNKYISDAGVCSRRACDRRVEEGRITIDGIPAELGQRVMPGQLVCVDGQPVKEKDRRVVLAVNKPRGIVCTAEKREKNNIIDFLNYPIRIYPVGRLDKDSEGLILMTNDGALMNEILKAENNHEKEYKVRVDHPVTDAFLEQMAAGVALTELGQTTAPCKVYKTDKCNFTIVLTQGLNRQIRRMCEALGYRVRWLKRVRVMNINLNRLAVGSYREIKGAELAELEQACGLRR